MKKTFLIIFVFVCIFPFLMCKSNNDVKNNDNKTTTTTTATTTTTTTKVEKIDQRTVFVIDDRKANDEDFLRTHMKDLFNSIEEKIASGDYEAWYSSISKSYKEYINDPAMLTKWSEESDSLINRGIKLKNSKDYFEYVVIQSREKKIVRFYNYQYIDKSHVKVICMLDDKMKFIYNFIYENNSWKLDR